MTSLRIRYAVLDDIRAITDIYNHAVQHTTATFDTEPKSLEDRTHWFHQHNQDFAIMVAEQHGVVIGWASLSRWSDRRAYDTSAEVSIYVHVDHRGAGVGNQLLGQLMSEARRKKVFHTVLARIAGDNPSSLHLHHKHGFERIGTMKEVGCKFGRFIDVHLCQAMLDS